MQLAGRAMKSIWIFRLRATISILGLFVLTLNIIGFFFGFVFLDLSTPQITTDQRMNFWITRHFPHSLTTSPGPTNRPDSTDAFIKTALPSASLPSVSLPFASLPSVSPPSASLPSVSLPSVPLPSASLPSSRHPVVARKTVLSKIITTTPGFSWGPRNSSNVPTRSGLRPQNSPCVLQKGRDPEDGVWYDFSVDDTLRFYVYSAFIDDRESIGSDPVVRIIALSTKLEKDDLNDNGRTLYCALHHEATDSGNQTAVVVQMESKVGPIGYGLELDGGVKLKEYIFTCPMENGRSSLPVAVTITGSPDRLLAVASCVPIEVPAKPPVKQDFAVCVQVSYGQLDPHRLIEWLELQRLLGVSRVGVYDQSVESGPGLEVLRHYARKGFVELRKTDVLPVPGPSQYLLHGSPVINDCLYRNLHSFDWILVVDFDEVLVPKNHSNLGELAAHLNRTSYRSPNQPGPANYLFLNQYFFLDSEPDREESVNYTILRYRRKAPLSPSGYAMKGYVDPQGCVQMHNHYCMGVTKAFAARNHYEFVHESLATSHHYKKCHLPSAECKKMLEQTTQDDVMMTYRARLKRIVEKKIRKLLR